MMTIYQKRLQEIVRSRCCGEGQEDVVDLLFRVGVIDNTLVKVLVIREYVGELLKGGTRKMDAIWEASEVFACSYEYVRKCVYYYKDINLQ